MASAIPRIRLSLTLQPKRFQLFHPMGGVRASPLETGRTGVEVGAGVAPLQAAADPASARPETSATKLFIYSPGDRGR